MMHSLQCPPLISSLRSIDTQTLENCSNICPCVAILTASAPFKDIPVSRSSRHPFCKQPIFQTTNFKSSNHLFVNSRVGPSFYQIHIHFSFLQKSLLILFFLLVRFQTASSVHLRPSMMHCHISCRL